MTPYPSVRVSLALSSVVAVLALAPARAAESYDNCTGTITSLPATITTQGVWCLTGDLQTGLSGGDAITVAANNVTIDCNEFKLGGLAAGTATLAVGIRVQTRMNAVVRRCNIRGFHIGLWASDGGGHVVEDNRVVGSTRIGIRVESAGSLVARNLVTDTGGTTAVIGESTSTGIWAGQGTDVIDNVVAGIEPGSGGGSTRGIYSGSNDDAAIIGNRIRGFAPTASGDLAHGIYNFTATPVLIRDNAMFGPGPVDGVTLGINCSYAVTKDNVIVGFESGAAANCVSSGDIVQP